MAERHLARPPCDQIEPDGADRGDGRSGTEEGEIGGQVEADHHQRNGEGQEPPPRGVRGEDAHVAAVSGDEPGAAPHTRSTSTVPNNPLGLTSRTTNITTQATTLAKLAPEEREMLGLIGGHVTLREPYEQAAHDRPRDGIQAPHYGCGQGPDRPRAQGSGDAGARPEENPGNRGEDRGERPRRGEHPSDPHSLGERYFLVARSCTHRKAEPGNSERRSAGLLRRQPRPRSWPRSCARWSGRRS